MNKRIVVGITGASGVIYGVRTLEALKTYAKDYEVHLVITPSGKKNLNIETNFSVEDVVELSDVCHDYHNLAASISSGSFPVVGMVVVPCSMRSLSDIACCRADNLLSRAADVTLKEKRPLIIVPRETPMHKGHLELLVKAADYGATILPPFPAFYQKPKSIDDIINHTVGKILERFNIDHNLYTKWRGE